MDVNIGETPAGRLKMELFSDIVPKSVVQSSFFITQKHFLKLNWKRTAENFRQLCTGEYRYVRDLYNKRLNVIWHILLLESIQDPKGTRMRRFIGQF